VEVRAQLNKPISLILVGVFALGCSEKCETLDEAYLSIYQEEMRGVLQERFAKQDSSTNAYLEETIAAHEDRLIAEATGTLIRMEAADGRYFTLELGTGEDSLKYGGTLPPSRSAKMFLSWLERVNVAGGYYIQGDPVTDLVSAIPEAQ